MNETFFNLKEQVLVPIKIVMMAIDHSLLPYPWNSIIFQFAAVCKLNNEKPFLSYEDFKEQIDSLDKDETVQLIQDLSILELCLIIAMKHHVEIYDNQAMNFEMIFTRYMKFANAHSSIQSFQRPVVFKAFEHIKVTQLINSNVSFWNNVLKILYQYFAINFLFNL